MDFFLPLLQPHFTTRPIKKNGEKDVNANNLSSADEIKKFKDLLDSGVITQEEFDAKKKQLLGL